MSLEKIISKSMEKAQSAQRDVDNRNKHRRFPV